MNKILNLYNNTTVWNNCMDILFQNKININIQFTIYNFDCF